MGCTQADLTYGESGGMTPPSHNVPANHPTNAPPNSTPEPPVVVLPATTERPASPPPNSNTGGADGRQMCSASTNADNLCPALMATTSAEYVKSCCSSVSVCFLPSNFYMHALIWAIAVASATTFVADILSHVMLPTFGICAAITNSSWVASTQIVLPPSLHCRIMTTT